MHSEGDNPMPELISPRRRRGDASAAPSRPRVPPHQRYFGSAILSQPELLDPVEEAPSSPPKASTP